MYRIIWDNWEWHPAVKILIIFLLALGITAALFLYAFPWAAANLPYPFGSAGTDQF